MPSGNARARLKAKLVRMKPNVRALAVKGIQLKYRSTLDPLNKRVLMKSGLSLNPETNRLEVDQERATAQMADKSPLVARQAETIPDAPPPTD